MNAFEAKAIIIKFKTALDSNDVSEAIRILQRVKKHHFRTISGLEWLSVCYVQYMQAAALSHRHPLRLEELVRYIAENFPTSYETMHAELIYYSQIVFDDVYAYSVLQNILREYAKDIKSSLCQYACMICISLKRFDEAQLWLNRGRMLIDASSANCENEAFDSLEVNILQRTGKYRESIELVQNKEITCANQDYYHFSLARSYYLLGEQDLAEEHICKAINICPDAQNFIQHAQILFATHRYENCLAAVKHVQAQIEEEWGSTHSYSNFREHLNVEAFKLLIKTAIKLGKNDEARVYLESAKQIAVYQEYWQDIEDLWPDANDIFAQKLQEEVRRITSAYPNVPDKAIFFIARADAVADYLANPELWYDAICRDRGLAFEIILRDIVCRGENTMNLNGMIKYVNGKPGDILYGSKNLHILKNIRNKNSHAPAATAADVAESRRILFEEVLAKLQ